MHSAGSGGGLSEPRETDSATSSPVVAGVCLDDVDDRVAGVCVEASRSEQRGADIAGPERVTAAAVCRAKSFGLAERMDREPPRSLEPAVVAGARERLEEGETVARSAVADAMTLLVAMRAGLPDQLGGSEQQFFVEVLPGAGGDTGRSGTPLEADAALCVNELRTRRTGPVRETVLAEGSAGEHARRLSGKHVVRLEPEQRERIAGGAVKCAETAVVLVLPPEPVVAAPCTQRCGRLARRRWDGGGQETGEGVAVASDGSVYVTGVTDGFGGFGHLFVLRFAPDGALVWQRIRDVATDAAVGTGQAITVAADGSIYAAGVTPRAVVGEFDMLLLKLDSQGTLVWQRTFSAADVADARGGVAVGSDGSVYVAGGIQAVTKRTAVNDTFVAKFGPDGSLIWDRGYGGNQGDFPGGIVARTDGTVLIRGESASFGAGSDDACLLQLDANGKGVVCNSWGGPGIDHGDDVELAPNGTIVLAGTTASSPPFTFATCGRQTRRLRGTVGAPEVPFADATGTLADPGGTVATPNGTSPGAGGTDAALVRVAP